MTHHEAAVNKAAGQPRSTILVVDDQPGNIVEALSSILEPRDRVRVTLSGEQAWLVRKFSRQQLELESALHAIRGCARL